MNCPLCGAERPEITKAGRKRTDRTERLQKYCKKYRISLRWARTVGLERWESMGSLARKVIVNDIYRQAAWRGKKRAA